MNLKPIHVFGYIQGAYNLLTAKREKEKWGIVDQKKGKNIINIASFLECELIDENKIVSESVEKGSFASYNKVENPTEIKVLIAVEGRLKEIQDALNTAKKYTASTELVNIITPSFEYRDYNIERYDYQLKQSLGRGILYLQFFLVEVRQVQNKYGNVKLAPEKKKGLVQTKTAKSAGNTKKNTAINQSRLRAGVGKIPNPWNAKP